MFERVKALFKARPLETAPLSERTGWASWQDLHHDARLLRQLPNVSHDTHPRHVMGQCGLMLGTAFKSRVLDRSATPTLICGPCRTGKTSSVVIPSMTTWFGAVVIFDRFGETFKETAAFRAQLGPVHYFNPFAHHSAGYNPLDQLEHAQGDARTQEVRELAHVISTHVDATDEVRVHGEEILTDAMMSVLALPLSMRHLGQCLRVLHTYNMSMYARPMKAQDDTSACDEHTNTPQNRVQGLAFAKEALALWAHHSIQQVTKRSDFCLQSMLSYSGLSTLYVCIDPGHATLCIPLMRVLVHQLTQLKASQERSPRMLLMLDDVSDYPRFYSLHRALKAQGTLPFKLCMVAHTMDVMKAMYGELVEHMAQRFFFGVYSDKSAAQVSDATIPPGATQPLLTSFEAHRELWHQGVLWMKDRAPALITYMPYYEDRALKSYQHSIEIWLANSHCSDEKI